jgi:hypothetical protein
MVHVVVLVHFAGAHSNHPKASQGVPSTCQLPCNEAQGVGAETAEAQGGELHGGHGPKGLSVGGLRWGRGSPAGQTSVGLSMGLT